jgi:hypothetical protein
VAEKDDDVDVVSSLVARSAIPLLLPLILLPLSLPLPRLNLPGPAIADPPPIINRDPDSDNEAVIAAPPISAALFPSLFKRLAVAKSVSSSCFSKKSCTSGLSFSSRETRVERGALSVRPTSCGAMWRRGGRLRVKVEEC